MTNRQPEHTLQAAVKKFAGNVIEGPFRFLAFDRSRKSSPMQHVFEKARGVEAGTPDCVLLVPERPAIWCELKWGPNKPSDEQIRIAREIKAAGHIAFTAWSVRQVLDGWIAAGVPVRANAALIAEDRDLRLVARAAAPKKASRARAPRPDAAKLRKIAAVRSRVIF